MHGVNDPSAQLDSHATDERKGWIRWSAIFQLDSSAQTIRQMVGPFGLTGDQRTNGRNSEKAVHWFNLSLNSGPLCKYRTDVAMEESCRIRTKLYLEISIWIHEEHGRLAGRSVHGDRSHCFARLREGRPLWRKSPFSARAVGQQREGRSEGCLIDDRSGLLRWLSSLFVSTRGTDRSSICLSKNPQFHPFSPDPETTVLAEIKAH